MKYIKNNKTPPGGMLNKAYLRNDLKVPNSKTSPLDTIKEQLFYPKRINDDTIKRYQVHLN